MKVALVSTIRPETNYTTYLINALQKGNFRDLKILVFTDRDKKNLNVPLRNIKLVWDRNQHFLFQILRQALKDKVDLLHLQHEINMYGGARTAVLFPFLVGLSRLFGFKVIVTVHAAIPREFFNEQFLKTFNWPKPKLFTPLVKMVFSFVYFLIGLSAHKLIVHTKGIKDCLSKDYKISSSKIVVIPHGVPDEISRQSSAISRQLKEWKPFVLYFGYIHRRKGLEYLIKAFKLLVTHYPLPNTHLIISGGAAQKSYLEELKALVKKEGLERQVIFTGFINLSKLRCLLENCQFVVLPAAYSIAGSGPLAQVIAHHKPVICTKIGVFGEEIKEGENGLFCEPNNPESLKEAMVKLIEDKELCQRLVKGMEKMHKERCWSKIAKETVEVYNDLLPKT